MVDLVKMIGLAFLESYGLFIFLQSFLLKDFFLVVFLLLINLVLSVNRLRLDQNL